MVAHWDSSRDGKCPGCGRKENATRLNIYPSEGRTKLLEDMVTDLRIWLYKNYAHPELTYWIPKYIELCGTHKVRDFPHLSMEMKEIAVQQDLIS